MNKPVILTGLRANNDLHIGNYLGALLPIIDLANKRSEEYQVNLFVPDLHSFTTPIDFNQLQSNIMSNLKLYVAAGLPLDNPEVHIYRQSYIAAHSELTWILDCFSGMGELNRMTQFKEKSASLNADRISVGLFNYPVLMAADILLYRASYVPVGDDQTQHLEFTRDIASRLNNQFDELFVIPKPVPEQHKFFGKDQGLRVMDLVEPTKKMSKSDASGKGVIFLSEDPETAKKKIMAATTDSLNKITYNKTEQPGIANMLELISLIAAEPLNLVIERYDGQTQYGPLKAELADLTGKFLNIFQSKFNEIDEQALIRKLEESEKLMNEKANSTLLKVQRAVGLRH
jgi:tryptophanyl-tRNA synthetase